jgi:ERCC4-type nuclease
MVLTINSATQLQITGDYMWVYRNGDKVRGGKEFVLPVVVERKRVDDLAASMHDGRQITQGAKMQHARKYCKTDLVYLIEGDARCSFSPLQPGLPSNH